MNSLATTGPRGAFFSLLLLLGLGACSPDASATAGAESQSGENAKLTQAQRDVLDLIVAVTPFSPVDPPAEKSAWYGRRTDLLRRLRAGGPEVGREALRMYHARNDSIPEIRSGLLEVAAFAAPEETRPVLVDLISTYGDELFVRTQATEFLAATSPETALEVLGPILSGEIRGTFPPEDQLLEAYSTAANAAGADPIPLLCDIATDPKRDASARHLATRLLGDSPGPQSRQALELLLLESSGNQYIRRMAAQSLRGILPAEELCALLRPVIEREADPNFQIFLDTMVQQSCP